MCFEFHEIELWATDWTPSGRFETVDAVVSAARQALLARKDEESLISAAEDPARWRYYEHDTSPDSIWCEFSGRVLQGRALGVRLELTVFTAMLFAEAWHGLERVGPSACEPYDRHYALSLPRATFYAAYGEALGLA